MQLLHSPIDRPSWAVLQLQLEHQRRQSGLGEHQPIASGISLEDRSGRLRQHVVRPGQGESLRARTVPRRCEPPRLCELRPGRGEADP